MRRSVLACSLLLSGVAACSSVTLDPTKREFWLGGTVDPTDRARLARADSLDNTAALNRDEHLACMSDYGTKHAAGTNLPADIADAAAATCRPSFDGMMRAARDAYDLRIEAAHPRPAGQLEWVDRRSQRLAELSDSIRERARQATIKAIVDRRP